MGHGPGVQALSSSMSIGQAVPPCDAAVIIERVRWCRPPLPHVTEHAVHAPHALTKQFTGDGVGTTTGHGVSDLQRRESDNGGHAFPPLATAETTCRERFCSPLPQVFVQEPHVVHSPTVQSTGQSLTEQSRESESAGQL